MSENQEELDALLEKADQEIGQPMQEELEGTEEERKEKKVKRQAEELSDKNEFFREFADMSDEEQKKALGLLPKDPDLGDEDNPKKPKKRF